MAEQEACTELVEKASREQSGTTTGGTTIEGESQLLPLLQGLLEAPDNEQTADSGTESGEDHRNSLIAEVQNALDKLSASLKDNATDITPERRSSLLQLVTKLQVGLATSVPQERRASLQGRFRRRSRPNRHTVGVSSEELADARRLIEEISLKDLTSYKPQVSLLQKQNSEGSVPRPNSSKIVSPHKIPVKNATAKPFSSSNSTISGNSSTVQTPTDPAENLDLVFNTPDEGKKSKLSSRSTSVDDVNIKSVQQAVTQAAANKVLSKSKENLHDSETEDESTVKPEELLDVTLPQPDLIMQNNPIYNKHEEKVNRFNTKKLKMKRANTIDIPKPLLFYEDEDDSDYSGPDDEYTQRRRNTYLALRGPIKLGNPNTNKNNMPVLQPKTDNDRKFLAFINKHNDNPSNKTSLWSTKPAENTTGTVWTNKFGNIKSVFEQQSTPKSSARQFWKSADDAVSLGPKIYDGPRISRQSARNLQQMFEEKQKQTQVPWAGVDNQHVVTGSLKVKSFEPVPMNKFSHAPQSAFKPIPKKTIIKSEVSTPEHDSTLFLYSPKPLTPTSPTMTKPWLANSGESRVLNLAASKFEHLAQPEKEPVKPRKLNKDRITAFQQPQPQDLNAPYLVKKVDGGGDNVRKLSGQYDNNYTTFSSVKYAPVQKQPSLQHPQQYNQNPPFLRQHSVPQPSSNQYHQQQYVQSQPQQVSAAYQQRQEPQFTSTYQYQPSKPRPQSMYQPQVRTSPVPSPLTSPPYERQSQPQYKNQNQTVQYRQPQENQVQYRQPQDNNQTVQYRQPQDNQVQYHQPQNNHVQYRQPQNNHVQYRQPQQPQYQPEQPQYQPQQLQYQPQESRPQIQSPPYQGDVNQKPTLDSQVSVESVKEYLAVNSRVMTGPVSQQATTVRQKSPMSRGEHDMAAALGLRNALQKIGNNKEVPQKPVSPIKKTLSPHSFTYGSKSPTKPTTNNFDYRRMDQRAPLVAKQPSQNIDYRRMDQRAPPTQEVVSKPAPKIDYRRMDQRAPPSQEVAPKIDYRRMDQRAPPAQEISKPAATIDYRRMDQRAPARQEVPKSTADYRRDYRATNGQSFETTSNGESVVTSKFHIPVINIPKDEPKLPTHGQILNKADAWNQICQQNQQPSHKPSPRSSPNARTVTKSKSSHSLLSVPKQFEAGMSKDEVALKKRTMEAFLSGSGTKSPQSLSRVSSSETINKPSDTKVVKRSINRIKTSEKISTFRQSTGLSRSRTLPDIVCPEMLDESNIDAAFEDLFQASS